MRLELGCYKHFKGKKYEVIGVARDCDDVNMEYVVYQAQYKSEEFGDNQLWIRNINDFLGTKEVNGQIVKRFEYIGDEK
jgi:hypothetical protein